MATLYNAEEADVICAGASARSLAFSCLRAGLRPVTCDLFYDSDLAARCPGTRIAADTWPEGILSALEQLPPLPVIYSGGLENHPDLISRIENRHEILGNGSAAGSPSRSGAAAELELKPPQRRRPPKAATCSASSMGFQRPLFLSPVKTSPRSAPSSWESPSSSSERGGLEPQASPTAATSVPWSSRTRLCARSSSPGKLSAANSHCAASSAWISFSAQAALSSLSSIRDIPVRWRSSKNAADSKRFRSTSAPAGTGNYPRLLHPPQRRAPRPSFSPRPPSR